MKKILVIGAIISALGAASFAHADVELRPGNGPGHGGPGHGGPGGPGHGGPGHGGPGHGGPGHGPSYPPSYPPAPPSYPPYPSDPYPPSYPTYPGTSDRVTEYVNRSFDGEVRVPLRRIFDQYRGRQIRSITLSASSDYGRGRAQVLVDGSAMGYPQALNSSYSQDYTFYLDSYHDTIGRDFSSLEMLLMGRVYVNSITVEVGGYDSGYPSNPGNGRVSCSISTYAGTFYGNGYDQGSAIADARNDCIARTNNARVCMDAMVSCNRY